MRWNVLRDAGEDHVPGQRVVVFDGGPASVTFYMDGATETLSHTPNTTLSFTSTTAAMGTWPNGGNNMIGVIDELAVYPTALLPARVTAHRAAGQ